MIFFFFSFPILRNCREQSFASAAMQLPLERHMVAISHQVQVHHQSREVRWNKCSSWCTREFKDGIWILRQVSSYQLCMRCFVFLCRAFLQSAAH